MKTWLRENHDLAEAYFWIVFAVPTVLFWRDSIILVLIISLYANAKTAQGAWKAERAARAAEAQAEDAADAAEDAAEKA